MSPSIRIPTELAVLLFMFALVPTQAFALDSDCDGFDDATDNCPMAWQSDQADWDGDGLGDVCDAHSGDSDGIPDVDDNCSRTSNPDQEDFDGDGLGQACDADLDGDGKSKPSDRDLILAASGKSSEDPDWLDYVRMDYNGDGQISVSDVSHFLNVIVPAWNPDPDPLRALDYWDPDADLDGVRDSVDNCWLEANSSQTDSDGDGRGDACDPDLDTDCIDDVGDLCIGLNDPDQADTDNDGFGEFCDCDFDQDLICGSLDDAYFASNSVDLDGDGNHDATDQQIYDAAKAANGGAPGPNGYRDYDGDGWADPFDNCPAVAGLDQSDGDTDGFGDVCDGDVYQTNPPTFMPTTFTIVVLPDTQNYEGSDGTQNFDNGAESIPRVHAEWICQNRASLNIVFATHQGDVVNSPRISGTNEIRPLWSRVSDSMYRIGDCGVPYSVVPGNHDNEHGSEMFQTEYDFTTYLLPEHFPPSRWAGSPYFVEASPALAGCFPPNSCADVNTAEIIDTNVGFSFLHLGVEIGWFNQLEPIEGWLTGRIADHPGLPVMVSSHALARGNSLATPCSWGGGTVLLDGQSEVFFTSGGHYNGEAECLSATSLGNAARVDSFANYQRTTELGYAPGWLWYCTFDIVADDVECRRYSPLNDVFGPPESEYSIANLGLASRFPGNPPWDTDGDGAADPLDNCSQFDNAGQENRDLDVYGDACDCDYDGDGSCDGDVKHVLDDMCMAEPWYVNPIVNCWLRLTSGVTTGVSGFDTDEDGNGVTNWSDVVLYVARFNAGLGPGPAPIP